MNPEPNPSPQKLGPTHRRSVQCENSEWRKYADNRVTRLGEFSPIGRWFTLGSFFAVQDVSYFWQNPDWATFRANFSPTHPEKRAETSSIWSPCQGPKQVNCIEWTFHLKVKSLRKKVVKNMSSRTKKGSPTLLWFNDLKQGCQIFARYNVPKQEKYTK
jgi:hypothetical protein